MLIIYNNTFVLVYLNIEVADTVIWVGLTQKF